MTIYDDMRGYVHTHDRNGWFDVVAETTPMYQMIDKADAENAKLREYVEWLEDCWVSSGFFTKDIEFEIEMKRRELGIEVSHD